MKPILLTGIRATGLPHIGNYYGSIKPLLRMQEEYRIFQLIADLHAVPHVRDGALLNNHVRSITACYLSCGLDVQQSVLWRQSQIREMAWVSLILMSLISVNELDAEMKLMANQDIDMLSGIYPVLMAADTLMMGADLVFAGRDHETGLDFVSQLSQRFNSMYGNIFTVPSPYFPDLNQMVRGLDGRKMSKSFNNTISLLDSEDDLYQKIVSIKGADEVESLRIIADLRALTDAHPSDTVTNLKEAKQLLFEELNRELTPIRQKYAKWIGQPDALDRILQDGAIAAREQANKRMSLLMNNVGLYSSTRSK
ncbi:Tryptophan--tRNA ligase [compost metagenome]